MQVRNNGSPERRFELINFWQEVHVLCMGHRTHSFLMETGTPTMAPVSPVKSNAGKPRLRTKQELSYTWLNTINASPTSEQWSGCPAVLEEAFSLSTP